MSQNHLECQGVGMASGGAPLRPDHEHLQGKDLELGWLPRAGTDVAPLYSTIKLN